MTNIKLEDLEINNYMIYQDKDSFNFGIDAVLLANFALREYFGSTGSQCLVTTNVNSDYELQVLKSSKNSKASLLICDFCTGSLPIPLIMYAKRHMLDSVGAKHCEPSLKIDAFEIDSDQVMLCNKSITWNKGNLEDAKNIDSDINVICDDIKNIFIDREKYKYMYESYDLITCNPPYNKKGSGIVNLNDKKQIARHEISITFDDICKAARLLLKSNKKFYLIHHSERIAEIVMTLKSNSFEVKKLQFIHPNLSSSSTLVLIEAVKNASSGLKVLEPIIVFEKDGSYTEKIQKIYGK